MKKLYYNESKREIIMSEKLKNLLIESVNLYNNQFGLQEYEFITWNHPSMPDIKYYGIKALALNTPAYVTTNQREVIKDEQGVRFAVEFQYQKVQPFLDSYMNNISIVNQKQTNEDISEKDFLEAHQLEIKKVIGQLEFNTFIHYNSYHINELNDKALQYDPAYFIKNHPSIKLLNEFINIEHPFKVSLLQNKENLELKILSDNQKDIFKIDTAQPVTLESHATPLLFLEMNQEQQYEYTKMMIQKAREAVLNENQSTVRKKIIK